MPAISVEALAAGHGDCLWIECHHNGGETNARPWRLLIDGGLSDTWPTLRSRIETLAPDQRHIDLAVVTHIDADHIGGMLMLFSDDQLGVTFGDVWFNGRPHLPDARGQTRSVAQGESLTATLSAPGTGDRSVLPWNLAFAGGPAMCEAAGSPKPVALAGDRRSQPSVTLLGPQPKRLARLATRWEAELDRVRGGRPSVDDLPLAPPEPLDDLEALASTKTSADRSVPNGSSIVLLVEHAGASCLLTGDAFVPDLYQALAALAAQRGSERVPVDLFKLPHHGSRGNISRRLLELVPARHYLVSTNGHRFGHPDDVALARVITSAEPGLTLWFNYDTPELRRWAEPQRQQANRYMTEFPTGPDGGVRIDLDGRR